MPNAEPHVFRWAREDYYRLCEAEWFLGRRVQYRTLCSPERWQAKGFADAPALGEDFLGFALTAVGQQRPAVVL